MLEIEIMSRRNLDGASKPDPLPHVNHRHYKKALFLIKHKLPYTNAMVAIATYDFSCNQ